jgi:DNA-binding transcriptional ArsR family regulator
MKNPAQAIACAAKLAILADSTRLAVVGVLLGGPRNVTEINREIRTAQNLLSHHLRILRDAGIVISCREGKAVRYSLAPGVEVGSSHRALNLGCCSLTFEKAMVQRKAL